MPTYRYQCLDCKKRFEVFLTYQDYGKKGVLCPKCGSTAVSRRIERIRIAKDETARLQRMAEPDSLAGIEDNPRAFGKMMREMESSIGEDMGAEFDEVVGRLESGQSPDDIERELPDMAGENSANLD
jgi:putative FmdB family regulatory protein